MKQVSRTILLTTILAMVSATGCVTGGSGAKSREITLTAGGQCRVAGKTVPIEKVERALKADGAKRDTRISVLVPEEAPMLSVQKLLRTLSAAGYHKVHFKKPLAKVAYVTDEKKPKTRR